MRVTALLKHQILTLFLLALAFSCDGSTRKIFGNGQILYLEGANTPGRKCTHVWLLSVTRFPFGLVEYRECHDASGQFRYDFSNVSAEGIAWPRYTIIQCGSFYFTVRAPASVVTVVAVLGIPLLIVLAVTAFRLLRQRKYEPTAA